MLAVTGLVVVPLVFAPGLREPFRAIKELIVRAEAILALFVLAFGFARFRELLRERFVLAVLGGAVLWTAITTLTSTHRLLSLESLVTTIWSAVLFVCVWYAAQAAPAAVVLALIPGVAINTVFIALQEYRIWNPFFRNLPPEQRDHHMSSSALIGNPNDVGAYLALCATILLVASAHFQGWKRWTCASAGVIAVAGVFVSQTRTAVISVLAALIVIAFRRSWKAAVAAAVVVALAFVAATVVSIPVLSRLAETPRHVAAGKWDLVLSDRIPPFLAAFEMFRDRPLLGVGPGAYKFHYMPYRISLAESYPPQFLVGPGVNFGETHNDHLQVLAETGVPGYALFLAALVALGWKNNIASDRSRFALALALPFAIQLFVLCLASFPLQIAVTRHLILTIAALIVGWRSS